MNIKLFIKKLRAAADSLEDVLGFSEQTINLNENPNTAKKIKKEYKKRKGLHWTQRPENRAKVLKLVKKAQKARYGQN